MNTLQENIVVNDNAITGTLKHVTDFKGFSSKVKEQSGNFLALSLGSNGATIKTELIGGTKGEVEVTDGFCVYHITAKDSQKVKVTATKQGTTETKIYDLSGLICNEE